MLALVKKRSDVSAFESKRIGLATGVGNGNKEIGILLKVADTVTESAATRNWLLGFAAFKVNLTIAVDSNDAVKSRNRSSCVGDAVSGTELTGSSTRIIAEPVFC